MVISQFVLRIAILVCVCVCVRLFVIWFVFLLSLVCALAQTYLDFKLVVWSVLGVLQFVVILFSLFCVQLLEGVVCFLC